MYPYNEELNDTNTAGYGQIFDNTNNMVPTAPFQAEMPNMMPMPMAAPRNGQTVPNVMMDMSGQQMQQQQNVNQGYINANQGAYIDGAPQQQTATYDLNVPPFDIEDLLLRRQFFRKVFIILLLQNILALPVIGIFLLCTSEPMHHMVYSSFVLFGFIIFIGMYIYSDYRRHAPVNVLALIFVTVFVTIQEGINATMVGTGTAFGSQFVVIIQYIAMIAYSKQTRFKFTNINAIFFTIIMYVLIFAIVGFIAPHFLHGAKFWSAFNVMYAVYDTQLQLSGHHGYNLKAEEHIFGAVNIYADVPNLFWRLFRYIFLDHFVRMYNFFKQCCFAEVC